MRDCIKVRERGNYPTGKMEKDRRHIRKERTINYMKELLKMVRQMTFHPSIFFHSLGPGSHEQQPKQRVPRPPPLQPHPSAFMAECQDYVIPLSVCWVCPRASLWWDMLGTPLPGGIQIRCPNQLNWLL